MPAVSVHFSDLNANRDVLDIKPSRDDYRRQKLMDVEEETDDLESFERSSSESPSPRKSRNYSVSSNVSMDTLWELHPRRLSEAGLRRHSDTSVVLTEDTDCFIIGMRVWVGGTKPGQIAYLGETQFAPGEWAGIVLDEPIGKNDGSVSGTRYFQCEPKRGVFSRLTRLTLSPLESSLDTSQIRSPTNGSQLQLRAYSPSGSTRSSYRTPSLNTSTVSLSSSNQDIKLGDRVIVQSSQGSKAGILRYIGTTDFAKGEWCGVELNDPLGKNDGCVEGRRYFTCQPKFGLFAPLSKVSRSPSSRRSIGQCIVHKSTTPSLHRAGSRESMTSINSAASSVRRVRLGVTSLSSAKKPQPKPSEGSPISKTPLQDVLREQEHHIDQLLKEREADRSEITRSAIQTQQTAEKLLNIQQEYEKYRLDCETKIRDQNLLIEKLEKQSTHLVGQLEDEKKKLEDTQFRFEEETLTKDDIEAASKNHLSRIHSLEEQLKNEQQKNEQLSEDAKRVFVLEKTLSDVQKQMETLQVLQNESYETIELKESEILTLKTKLEESSLLLAQTKIIQDNKTKEINHIITEKENLEKENAEKLNKLTEKLNNAYNMLKEKYINSDIIFLKEIKKAEIETSAKVFDCETNAEEIKQLQLKLKHLEDELKNAKSSDSQTDNELLLKAQIEGLRNILKTNASEFLKVKKEHAMLLIEKEMEIHEKNIRLKHEINENQKIKSDYAQIINDLNQSFKTYKERTVAKMETTYQEMTKLLNNLHSLSKDLIIQQLIVSKLEKQLSLKDILIAKLKSEIASYAKVHEEQNDYISKLNEQLRVEVLKSTEYERNNKNFETIISQLTDEKKQHESVVRAIVDASKDSNKQLFILNEEFRKTVHNLDSVKKEMNKKIDAAATMEQELKYNLQSLKQQYQLEKTHLEEQLKLSKEAEEILKEKFKITCDESSTIQNEMKQQIIDLNTAMERAQLESNHQLDIFNNKIKELEQILDVSITDSQQLSAGLSRRIEELVTERDQLKIFVKDKTKVIIETEEKIKEYSTDKESAHEKQVQNLKQKNDEFIKSNTEKELLIQNLKNELESSKTICSNYEQKLSDSDNEIKRINEELLKVNESCADLKHNLQLSNDKVNQLTVNMNLVNTEKQTIQSEINDLQNQIKQFTTDITNLQTENTNLNNNLIVKDEKLQQLSDELKQIQTELLKLKSSLKEKDNNIIALKKQLEDIIKEKGTASETFAAQEKKIMELNIELEKNYQEKVLINEELIKKSAHIEDLTTQLQKSLDEDLKEYIKEQINYEKTINTAKQNIDALTNEIKALKSEISSRELEINQLKTELNESKEVNNNKINNLENLKEEKLKVITNLESELQKLKQDWNEPINNPVVIQLNEKLEKNIALFQEKETEIHALTERIQLLNEDRKTDSDKIQTLTERIQLLNEDKKADSDKIAGLELQISSFEADIKTLTETNNKLTTEISVNSNDYAQLSKDFEEKIQKLNLNLKEKESELNELKEQYTTLTQAANNSSEITKNNEQLLQQMKNDIQSLQSEKLNNEQLLQQLKNDLQSVQSEKLNLEHIIDEKEKHINELCKKLAEFETVSTSLNKQLDTFTKQWEQPNNNPIFKEITTKLEEKQLALKNKEEELTSLKTKIQLVDQQNQQIQQTWQQSITQWKTKLCNLENIGIIASQQCDSLEEQVKVLQAQQKNNENNGNESKKQVQFEEFNKQMTQDHQELLKALENTQLKLIEREKQLNHQRNELNNLQKQFADKNDQKDLECLEKMNEEKEFAIGQVSFLNSIIVDMQQKNKELESKVKLLENGFLDTATENNDNHGTRVIPPRQYCDICEVFDKHETEDCPIQTDCPVVTRDANQVRKIPQARPYCEICEEFGHDTENCDADETY